MQNTYTGHSARHDGLLGCFKRYPLRVTLTWNNRLLPQNSTILYFDTPEDRTERAVWGLTYNHETVVFLPATIAWEPITV